MIESLFSDAAIALDPDPSRPEWVAAPPARLDRDYLGAPLPGPPTEVRSRWTREQLSLLYTCPYDALNLKPNPDVTRKTPYLWDWDVAEAFIGWDPAEITRYKEFQVSPQGEWVDLDIDRADPKGQAGMQWDSGFTVAARIDPSEKVWHAVMRIPFAAVDPRVPTAGRELRMGLFRIAGVGPAKRYYAWRPTGQTTFHVPEAFGTLRLL